MNNETGVTGRNYTISNQPGVVGSFLLIQMNSAVLSTLSLAEIQVKAGKWACFSEQLSFCPLMLFRTIWLQECAVSQYFM